MTTVFICPFCGRDDIYRKCSFTRHVNYCNLNPDRVEISEETRKKLHEANIGKKHSDKTKQKISTSGKIAQNKPEVRQKISEAIKKLWENPEYKQKNSEAQKGKTLSEETRKKMSEAMNDPDVRQKIYNTKKQNNSFNSSKIETELKNYFDSNNILYITQYKSDVYPFMCDLYFPDKDLYVEIQGTWTHGGKPFDASDIGCINQLALWKSKNKPFYLNAIDTWTNRDVRKRNYAKEHKLNWIEIFSDDLDECLEAIKNKLMS